MREATVDTRHTPCQYIHTLQEIEYIDIKAYPIPTIGTESSANWDHLFWLGVEEFSALPH